MKVDDDLALPEILRAQSLAPESPLDTSSRAIDEVIATASLTKKANVARVCGR
ncbi:MAG: hypothetical protein R3F54_23055 [Alphaproteobacteria bacterium]